MRRAHICCYPFDVARTTRDGVQSGFPRAVAATPRSRTNTALALLIIATAIWGATFLLVKNTIAVMPAMRFLSLRFVIAVVVMFAARPRYLLRLGRITLQRGCSVGLILSLGFVLQTVGLEHTSAAVSGFITGLQIVFTPILAWPLLRHRCSVTQGLAVVLATAGLAMMSLRGVEIGLGAVLTLLGALCFALQIIMLGAWSTTKDSYGLAFVQIATVAVVCTIATIPGGFALPPDLAAWSAVLGTGVFATALALGIQSWAQSVIAPTRAAIVYTLEPAFAALFAYLGGEHVGVAVLGGGAFVLAAMLLAEFGPRVRSSRGVV